ncbi:50S ribosomal protein L19e [Acidianus ambivalens]|uniref:Large ribosomal subunit protein eL19 n=1 Tax=Acidianus ambivalens TaxID=2283 RepID=A0A650CXW4_ACIAM|nr:50S ribosomal protein L19e [Acidianus ambivalens]MQL54858.1 50S ribosomal protein L19e [Acidianus ambivalens]QGR22646.1 50S ribosomal protein L19e [Acidianus ambivalens]
MPELYLQKRLAADIAKVGINNVKIPPENIDEVKEALTRADIARLIKEGKIIIEKEKERSNSKVKERRKARRVKGEGRRHGSRKGKKTARFDEHEAWVNRIRKIRKYLKWLRDHEVIDSHLYRQLYIKAKGGSFKSISDVRSVLIQMGKLKGE